MGLFADAQAYKGRYYRQYSQTLGSQDLSNYFADEPISHSGLCAGCSMDWIRFYLTRQDSTLEYSNQEMAKNKNGIVALQRGLRARNQSLKDFALLSGLKPHPFLDSTMTVKANNTADIAEIITSTEGLRVISYNHPTMGRHVVTCYVDENKQMYFSDTHKGDVCIPYPGSSEWLNRYLELFVDSCGQVSIENFDTEFNEQQYNQAMRTCSFDSLRLPFSGCFFKPRQRTVDDLDFDDNQCAKASMFISK